MVPVVHYLLKGTQECSTVHVLLLLLLATSTPALGF